MTHEEIIDLAIIALGTGRADDYILSPTQHAEELKTGAPALARLLRTAKIEAWARQYERLDAEAISAQRLYKRVMAQANAAVLATAMLSAIILVAWPLGELLGIAGGQNVLTTLLGLSALLTGAFASMSLSRVRQGGLLDAWKNARARAENARENYFKAIAEADIGTPSEIPPSLLKLEYFRRYQLDVQIAYYAARRREHQKSADRTLMLASLAVAPASVATGAAGLLGSAWASLAVLGVIGAAVSAFASTREAINNDRVNAERYGATLSELELLRGALDEVRAALAQSASTAVLGEYIAQVHDKLSTEHGKWKEEIERARSAADTLAKSKEEALAGVKPKAEP